MAIIANQGNAIIFRVNGREVTVTKTTLRKRGNETDVELNTRLSSQVRGATPDREFHIYPDGTLWQGPLGSTPPVLRKIVPVIPPEFK